MKREHQAMTATDSNLPEQPAGPNLDAPKNAVPLAIYLRRTPMWIYRRAQARKTNRTLPAVRSHDLFSVFPNYQPT